MSTRPAIIVEPPPRLRRLRPGAGRDLDARRQRPQQHAFEHGEALRPRCRRRVEAVEELPGEATPQRVERHDIRGELAGRQAEQRSRPRPA